MNNKQVLVKAMSYLLASQSVFMTSDLKPERRLIKLKEREKEIKVSVRKKTKKEKKLKKKRGY